jgi:putative redox protein
VLVLLLRRIKQQRRLKINKTILEIIAIYRIFSIIYFKMPTASIQYLGDLRCEAEHLQSGTKILTDAPTDNHGKGEAFSPTDLVATALGTCILTTMAIFASRDGIELAGSVISATKIMSSQPPRRIARLEITLQLQVNQTLTEAQQQKYEQIGRQCPVARSLHPELEQVLSFSW